MAEWMLEVLRTEQKYPVSFLEAERMNALLGAVLHPDPHNGMNGYLVRSLYFDTPDNADYRDKEDGLELRRKLRLRIYGPDVQTAKLELKEKQGDDQRKRSLVLSREDAMALCAGDPDVLRKQDSEFALELYGRIRQQNYLPKCIVEYDRRAFVVAENDIRITLDSGLRANEANLDLFDPNLNCYPVGELGLVTMEVKFNRFLLSYVKDLVSLSNRTQASVSKYCAARVASLGGL